MDKELGFHLVERSEPDNGNMENKQVSLSTFILIRKLTPQQLGKACLKLQKKEVLLKLREEFVLYKNTLEFQVKGNQVHSVLTVEDPDSISVNEKKAVTDSGKRAQNDRNLLSLIT